MKCSLGLLFFTTSLAAAQSPSSSFCGKETSASNRPSRKGGREALDLVQAVWNASLAPQSLLLSPEGIPAGPAGALVTSGYPETGSRNWVNSIAFSGL